MPVSFLQLSPAVGGYVFPLSPRHFVLADYVVVFIVCFASPFVRGGLLRSYFVILVEFFNAGRPSLPHVGQRSPGACTFSLRPRCPSHETAWVSPVRYNSYRYAYVTYILQYVLLPCYLVAVCNKLPSARD